jgi:hypothetical protein
VLFALILRAWLVLGGGQFYWPDERGYIQAQRIVADVVSRNTGDIAANLDGADHPLFKIVAIMPASIEYATRRTDSRIGALFFATVSTATIWLVGAIAADLGAGGIEAVMAAMLAALSSALFYYARHLLPYDLSMVLALASLHVGLQRSVGTWRAVGAGVLAACAFLTYAGYWTLAGAALLLPLIGMSGWRDRLRRGAASGAGLLGFLAAALAVSHLLNGHLAESFITFSGTIRQGLLSEGWSLPFAYLWHAEHAMLIVWIGASIWAVGQVIVRADTPRIRVGLAGLVFVYLVLIVFSVALHKFVVYGRLARQLVPFFCLLTAAILDRLRQSASFRERVAAVIVLGALAIQAGFNFVRPLTQTFPDDFQRQARREAGQTPGARWVNTRYIYPRPDPARVPDGFRVVRQAAHPLEYLPYQYEGYTPDDRAALRAADLQMRLIVPLR